MGETAGFEDGLLLILGTFSKASRGGSSPLAGPDQEGSQAPSRV
jgi:hypothetical protein